MVVYNHYYASYMFNTYSFPITSFPPTQYSNDVKADSSTHMLMILKYEQIVYCNTFSVYKLGCIKTKDRHYDFHWDKMNSGVSVFFLGTTETTSETIMIHISLLFFISGNFCFVKYELCLPCTRKCWTMGEIRKLFN